MVEDAERDLPDKDHPPIQMIANPAAERRSAAAGGRECDREIGIVFGALLGRRHVAEHHLGARNHAAAAHALHHPAADQHQHAGRRCRDERAGHIDHQRDQQRGAPAVDIGEFAVERRERGRGDQVRRDHPGQFVDVAEYAADGRQRAGQDRLIDRAEEHRQHHAHDDDALFAVRQRLRLAMDCRRRPRAGASSLRTRRGAYRLPRSSALSLRSSFMKRISVAIHGRNVPRLKSRSDQYRQRRLLSYAQWPAKAEIGA